MLVLFVGLGERIHLELPSLTLGGTVVFFGVVVVLSDIFSLIILEIQSHQSSFDTSVQEQVGYRS